MRDRNKPVRGLRMHKRTFKMNINAVLLASLLLLSSGIIAYSPQRSNNDVWNDQGGPSLSGVLTIEEVATTTIYGLMIPPPGDLVGSYLWCGDLNGDDLDDIGFASTIDGSERGANFICGSKDMLPVYDMLEDFPVNASSVRSPRNIDSGDINGDGIQDYILAEKLDGFSFLGNDQGGWDSTAGVLSACPQNQYEYPYSDFMYIGEIDNDTGQEMVTGIFGFAPYETPVWKQPDTVTIYWSGGNGTTDIIAQEYDDFGSSLDVGDIDGDGRMDLVVGAPKTSYQEGYWDYTGAVYIFFNITDLKGSPVLDPEYNASVVIKGSDEYDQFGWNVMLEDIDGDGLDDILTGAPQADGLLDAFPGVGEILVFKGKDQRSFPREMDAENYADIVIIGAEGEHEGSPDYEGDKIGRVFQVVDMDGNGEKELVVSTPHKTLPRLPDADRTRAGAISIYRIKDLKPGLGKIAQLSYPSSTLSIEGMDTMDSFGWQVRSGDLNGDGFDDLLISAPQADGPGNVRKSSGEVYVIPGHGTVIERLKVSGPGATSTRLFTKGGQVEFNISFTNTRGWDQIDTAQFYLTRNGETIGLIYIKGEIIGKGGPFGAFSNLKDVEIGGNGQNGWFSFSMELEWHFPWEGKIDVMAGLTDKNGTLTFKTFEDAVSVHKDILLKDDIIVKADGKEIRALGSYMLPRTSLEVSGPNIVYKNEPSRKVPYGNIGISISTDGDSRATEYAGDWMLDAVLPQSGAPEYTLSPYFMEGMIPQPAPRCGGAVEVQSLDRWNRTIRRHRFESHLQYWNTER
jgi:hypothetical protein